MDPEVDAQLRVLAQHLHGRRDDLLLQWRASVSGAADLSTPRSLTRTQFEDEIPATLDAFERMLERGTVHESEDEVEKDVQRAAGHGLHRWQQGYDLREVTSEWGHFHVCLVREIEDYAAAHPTIALSVISCARIMLAEFVSGAMTASVAEYSHLREIEAAARADDLQQMLDRLKQLEVRRGHILRDVAHDLRGGVGLVGISTALLKSPTRTDAQRDEQLTILQSTVEVLSKLLKDFLTLAKLEAGREERNISTLDVSIVLNSVCHSMKGLAEGRGLFFVVDPAPAMVLPTDENKLRRIAQNLIVNAIEHTNRGGVRVCWSASGGLEREGWVLCVEDTGPGLATVHASELTATLRTVTEENKEIEYKGYAAGKSQVPAHPAPTLVSENSQPTSTQISGEGIGLAIVKRLCELLDASLELETQPEKGTTFRVTFPCTYDTPHASSSGAEK